MQRALFSATPQIGFESNDPVFSQIFNAVNQQPHYSAESLLKANSTACKRAFAQQPCKSIFEKSKLNALEDIAKDRLSVVAKNLKQAKIQQQVPKKQNLEIPISTLTTRPTGTRTSGGANGKQLLKPNPFYDPRLDMLAKSMTCIRCKKIVRPGLFFRCIDGHVHCDRCKGGSLTEFGRFCTKCKDVYKKKRKIRPNKALRETNPHIQEADKYIEKCNGCSHTYYNLGNGEREHFSHHIVQIWGSLGLD